MKKTKKINKKFEVRKYLNSGKGVTKTIAENRWDVKNLRATISDLVINENMEVFTQKDKKTGETKYTKTKKV